MSFAFKSHIKGKGTIDYDYAILAIEHTNHLIIHIVRFLAFKALIFYTS